MDPFTTPHDEVLLAGVKPEHETQEEMIIRLLTMHQHNVKIYETGQKYYDNKNDIKDRDVPKNAEGVPDYDKPDWRITHPIHANLVDQKVGHALTNPVSFKHKDESVTKKINELLGYEFDDDLNDIFIASSNKGIEWLHPFVNEDGEFKFMQIPAEQIVPIYADRKERELEAVIRSYTYERERRVEYWTKDDVTYYIYLDNRLHLGWYHGINESNPTTHLDCVSWGRVPFIPFKNNSQAVGDIWRYKTLIDAMDNQTSNVQNTFDEATELIYVLKGYEGENLSTFMRNLKHYKAINVDGDGGVDTIKIEVPVTSSNEWLEQLRKYIYDYGRGIDFQRQSLGNSPSGIALRFLYSDLDLKVKDLIRKATPAIKELLWFVFEFDSDNGEIADEVEISFSINRMVNELEQSQIASMSQTLISQDTVIENHPWVNDLEGEKERMSVDNIEYGRDVDDESRDDRQED